MRAVADERFFFPGPTEVRPDILATMSLPMVAHRGAAMRALLARVNARLPSLFGTERPVYTLTAAATGAMEAAVRSTTRRRVLSIVGGAFGARFARIAERCGREVHRLVVPPGSAARADVLRAVLERGSYDAITVVHVETSTGAVTELAPIARAARERNGVMVLVDAVSSVGGMPVNMDADGLDVVVSASQKALALPPGLSFAACSERALARAARLSDRGVYLDLAQFDAFWQRGETPTTPAIPQLYALDAQLAAIAREGLEARFARHAAMQRAVERWVTDTAARGVAVRILAVPGARAATVTCLEVGSRAPRVVAALAARGFVVGPGYGALAANTIRIGHMGDHSVAGVERLLDALGDVLTPRS